MYEVCEAGGRVASYLIVFLLDRFLGRKARGVGCYLACGGDTRGTGPSIQTGGVSDEYMYNQRPRMGDTGVLVIRLYSYVGALSRSGTMQTTASLNTTMYALVQCSSSIDSREW